MTLQPRAVSLATPVPDGGLSSTNFFNGQLLSSEDLLAEQSANRVAREHLGRALGEGIAGGLDVGLGAGSTTAIPVVTVQPGLAVSRSGRVLSLNRAVDVSLREPVVRSAAPTSGFSTALAPQAGPPVELPGQGVYLLVMAYAAVQQGSLPVATPSTSQNCVARYTVDAVRFDLLSLPLARSALRPENHALLRNFVAHACFGTDDPRLASIRTNPFGSTPSGYGLLDVLRPALLSDEHIPLAVVHWDASTDAGITFIDQWAVRRAMCRPELPTRWSGLIGGRRQAEAEAMFLQFQEQVDELMRTSSDVADIVATDYFRYLPPVGVLPIDPGSVPPAGLVPRETPPQPGDGSASVGFQHAVFFRGQTWDAPAFMDAALLEPLLRGAQSYAPIDLSSQEFIWLYWVRENRAARPGTAASTDGPLPYLVFTSGHVPYQGDSRLDLAYFGYSTL